VKLTTYFALLIAAAFLVIILSMLPMVQTALANEGIAVGDFFVTLYLILVALTSLVFALGGGR
jgi:hypothetical protein